VRALITGGAGFIGSILTPTLLYAGYKVTVLDNFMWDQNSLAGFCFHKDLEIVRGDARSYSTMKPLIAQADIIIPLAALVGAPLCDKDPIAAKTTNVEAIDMLCTHVSSEQRIIIPISNSGYGIGEPGKECTEASPLNPVSLYGKTKVEAEDLAMGRLNSISLRLATVFGMSPRMRLDLLVNDFVYRAVTDRALVLFEPHFVRNYIHIRDVARAFIHALANFDSMRENIFNVGLSNANLSKWQLCEKIKEHVPSFVFMEAPIGEDPDKRDYLVSNAKIEATGFSPAFTLDDGIRELLKGYKMLRNTKYGNV
jgi:nucleoside-diphosphate-sugar epimerase